MFMMLQVALRIDKDEVVARLVKGRLERTTLGQIARTISIEFKPGDSHVSLLFMTVCSCCCFHAVAFAAVLCWHQQGRTVKVSAKATL
jgi:hypothetical protein